MPSLPDDPVEREVGTLARKLQAARGFCYIVYFVEDRRASRHLQTGLATRSKSQGRWLVTVLVEAAFDLVAQTLGGVFAAAEKASVNGARPVVWAEAFRDNGDAAWDAQRRMLLMRMNERRSRFESELAAPLILLLPAGAQRDAASLAPDLWHVRLHSASLAVARTAASAADEPTKGTRLGASAAAPGAAPDAIPKEVACWHAVHGAALAAAEHDPQALDAMSLRDGFDAVHGWLRAGRSDRAVELAERLVAMARDRPDSAGAADAPASQTLAGALCEWGDSPLEAGDLERAISTLYEGVHRARSADASTGRDLAGTQLLSTLLFSVGNALLRSGRAREAEDRFQESLALVRLLPGAGTSRESSAVVTLLDRVGDAALASNDTRAAIEAYRESVALWRHLRESSGDDPALLRSLAWALARLGDAEWDAGQGERALTAYAESLSLLQEVLTRVGDNDEARSDLAAMLLRIGQVEQAVGRFDAALGAYEKVLALSRHLSARGVTTTLLLNSLARPLQRMLEAARKEAPPPDAAIDAAARLLAEVLAVRAAAPK